MNLCEICGERATRTVTGSMHQLTVGNKTVLLDCGLFQGKRAESFRRNRDFPFRPKDVHAVLLTHAHIDHSGWLPRLIRSGFKGQIHATAATWDLCKLVLPDAAHLQEEDAERAQRGSKHSNPSDRQPLYTSEDIDPLLRLFKPMPRKGSFDLSPEFHFDIYDAGHILGSCSFALTIHENGQKTVVVFSGDIGRYDQPIRLVRVLIGQV